MRLHRAPRRVLPLLPLALTLPLLRPGPPASSLPAARAQASPLPTGAASALDLRFEGRSWLHRWSRGGQNEFTPADQPDLDRWRDMLTLNLHERVRNGEQLADLANGVLARYGQAGRIVRTGSRPRTPTRPAEHLIVAVLAGQGSVEAAFARVLLADGVGLVVVVSRRERGEGAGERLGRWLKAAGPDRERELMNWAAIPSPAALRRLPTAP